MNLYALTFMFAVTCQAKMSGHYEVRLYEDKNFGGYNRLYSGNSCYTFDRRLRYSASSAEVYHGCARLYYTSNCDNNLSFIVVNKLSRCLSDFKYCLFNTGDWRVDNNTLSIGPCSEEEKQMVYATELCCTSSATTSLRSLKNEVQALKSALVEANILSFDGHNLKATDIRKLIKLEVDRGLSQTRIDRAIIVKYMITEQACLAELEKRVGELLELREKVALCKSGSESD